MGYLIKFLLALTLIGFIQAADKLWWETASFYQIYPRSFKDSDGDGIGDLNGVTEKLAYLKEIGITATWLSPIFTSPMADFGYDIANFTEIDPTFGTSEDFDNLLEAAEQIGVKIILDFVPNHSSDECEWFLKSVARDPEYEDFYVWHPGKIVNGTRQEPNNWISVFRGSQWTWNEEREEYYLHQFHAKQPDFNYRNPKVVEAMKDILRYWLHKGVAGFRVDAVPHIFEIAPDENGDWPDEPLNPDVSDPLDYNSLLHIYTVHQNETIDLVYQFRQVLKEVDDELGGDERLLMTEAYAPLNVLMQYYGNETVDGAQIPFNFELISSITNSSGASHYAELINGWLDNMPAGKTANWVFGNHDQTRIGSRLGTDRIDLINILLLTLPGCSVNYNGEEIGMTDVWISWNDTVDPQACQSNPNEYERLSRDPVRTPFQWNEEPLAGFTEGNTTWLPVAYDYQRFNVKRERGVALSHLNVFKQLQEVRAAPALREGATEVKAINNNVLGIKRFIHGDYVYVIVLNINSSVELIDLTAHFTDLSQHLIYVVITDKSVVRKNDHATATNLLLLPKEAVVLRSQNKL